jgi:hypothetical protein
MSSGIRLSAKPLGTAEAAGTALAMLAASGDPGNLADQRLLQGIQECKERLLIFAAKFAEAIPHVFGLAAVTFDGAF